MSRGSSFFWSQAMELEMGRDYRRDNMKEARYSCDISLIDFRRRQFSATLSTVGDCDYPSITNMETLFFQILWDSLPYQITHRTTLPKAYLETEEDKEIDRVNSGTAYFYDYMDISKFVYDLRQKGEFTSSDIIRAWETLPEAQKKVYIDHFNKRKHEKDALMRKLIKEKNLPPLAEVNPSDVAPYTTSIAWRYIQKVILEDESDDEDDEGNQFSTKLFTVIVTDPKWLIGVPEDTKQITYIKQKVGRIEWSKDLHHYFPVSFRERTKTLLMMRLPQHAQTNIIGLLPEPLFLWVLQYLAIMTYEENHVENWEIKKRSKRTKRAIHCNKSIAIKRTRRDD